MQNEFRKGDVVRIICGRQANHEGVISEQPRIDSNGQTIYTVCTVEYPLGEWLMKDEMELVTSIRRTLFTSYEIGRAIGRAWDDRKYLPTDMDPMEFRNIEILFPEYNIRHKIKNGFRVGISTSESIIPHVIVMSPKPGKKVEKFSYVSLASPIYLRDVPGRELTDEECERLDSFFETGDPRGIGTCWDTAISKWQAMSLGDAELDMAFRRAMYYRGPYPTPYLPPQPDYTKLNWNAHFLRMSDKVDDIL